MKRIAMNLFDSASIQRAIDELQDYKKQIRKNTAELQTELTKRVQERAIDNYNWASALYEGTGTVIVNSGTADGGHGVWAEGDLAYFLEFGTGVHYNPDVSHGDYPGNVPDGVLDIGEYGQKHGKQQYWTFQQGGQTVVTQGIRHHDCLFNAAEQTKQEITEIAREVFGK